MQTKLSSQLASIQRQGLQPTLTGMRRGIEKESLRVKPDGHLSQTDHPSALGSTLTHPWITTDYSEALLEFITPAFDTLAAPLDFLNDLHRFTYAMLPDECLWVNSMPCILGTEADIRIADYGSSNIGRMKHIYRHGLWHRYGRYMQTIAGIHYNVSFPEPFWVGLQQLERSQADLQDFISDQYFNLIRNFLRHVGMVIYLFGASPAVCESFLNNRKHSLKPLPGAEHTLYTEFGTSLRMSDLGYHNDAQAGLRVSYNNLAEYVADLDHAIRTPHPPYQALGMMKDGQHLQLNANILQIENEYYGSIRPKRTTQSGERPTLALARRGVEYIEMRCVDLDPFLPLGIDPVQMRFLEVFALFCLLEESPPISEQEAACIDVNREAIVLNGRNPALQLVCGEHHIGFHDWATRILDKMSGVAELLDQAHQCTLYSQAVRAQHTKIASPFNTRSAHVINDIQNRDQSFFAFAMRKAREHEHVFRAQPLAPDMLARMQAAAERSLQEQRDLEAQDELPLDTFIANYFSTAKNT